jgi:hypothetical protein
MNLSIGQIRKTMSDACMFQAGGVWRGKNVMNGNQKAQGKEIIPSLRPRLEGAWQDQPESRT